MKKFAAVLFILLVLGAVLWAPIPVSIGTGDFRAYWSASYLLRHGENFADPELLWALETEQTNWRGDFPIITWNPPWLLTLLLPYTLVSFERAAWLWLWSNIILVFSGVVLIWQNFRLEETIVPANRAAQAQRYVLLAPLAGLLFLPTLWALWMGQVNILVFAGLAGFLYFSSQKRPILSGTALALTMVKPHLVYVTVPLLLLRALWRREWGVLAGFTGVLLALSVVVLALRPSFLLDYTNTVGGGSLLTWETPTLGGWLGAVWGWQWAKWMGLAILPASVLIWWRTRAEWSLTNLVSISLFLSVITAPFGWQYDVVVLLVALLAIVAWLVTGWFGRLETMILAALLIFINIAAILQRAQTVSEVKTFWLPVTLALIYGWMKMRNVWN